jgi:16S rRNA (adenine1518-N6/adenine1519-N6)-dimethyltransferase
LRHGDALELLPRLVSAPTVICGNLPYYISTPLLMECLKLGGKPAQLFFLMQREVGQRLAGKPGNKTYGALSVLVQAAYDVELARVLPGSVFYPAPEVESVAVRLRPLPQPLVAAEERAPFATFVQRGFSQRRKKLSNLLPTRDARRAEELSPAEWVRLWRETEKEGEPPATS